MFQLLLKNYNISFNELFEIKEIHSNRVLGKYYFIPDEKDVFKLCKRRKCTYRTSGIELKSDYVIISDLMLSNIMLGFMRNKITIIKENN